MRTIRIVSAVTVVIGFILTATGCVGGGPEAANIKKVVGQFIVAVDNGDDDLAVSILLDRPGWAIMHPDLANSVDGASSADAAIGGLESQYRRMVAYFDGRDVKLKSFRLGTIWQEYPKLPGFKDTRIILESGGMEYEFWIPGMIRIAGKWRICDLSGNQF